MNGGMRRGPVRGKPSLKNIDMGTLKRLMAYLKKYRGRMLLVSLFIVMSAVTSAVSSLFLRTLIDDYITPLLLEASPVFSGLLRMLLIMAGIYLIGVVSTYLFNRIMVVVAQGTLKSIRDELFEHMQTLPIRYFDTHTFGDVMSVYTNDTDTLRQMIAQSLPQTLSSLVTLISVFFAMLTVSVWLTLFVVLFTILMIMVTGKIASKSGSFFMCQQQSLGKLNGYIEEMVNGQKVVKVFNHEHIAEKEFDSSNTELCEVATKANSFANLLGPINAGMGNILYVLIAIVGGVLAISGVTNVSLSGIGTVSLGMIASFLQLANSFCMPIFNVSQQLNSVVMAIAGAGRIFQLLDEKSETDEGYVTLVNAKLDDQGNLIETEEKTNLWAWKHPHHDGTITFTKVEGAINFNMVDFEYEEGKPVLHDITLYAEPSQKLAFVGATGAGKTTITNLINRFYDLADGKVRYDGININKIKKSSLRRSLGVVLQDVNLFTGTVMENIRYGRLDATDDECIAAAKLANAHDFITMLPNGYETVLSGDGSGLSQGQRQLISIARAAVADPPVMILDEATSSIDTRTESIVQKGMDRLMQGRTVFVIAHRLSTVKNADVIMVLDHGRIIERGTHDKLIAEKGTYYQLYTGAFELS